MKNFNVIIANVIDNQQTVMRILAWDSEQAKFIALHIATYKGDFAKVGTTAVVV